MLLYDDMNIRPRIRKFMTYLAFGNITDQIRVFISHLKYDLPLYNLNQVLDFAG